MRAVGALSLGQALSGVNSLVEYGSMEEKTEEMSGSYVSEMSVSTVYKRRNGRSQEKDFWKTGDTEPGLYGHPHVVSKVWSL